MTNYMKFDITCKYSEKKECYYGGVPSLGIEIEEACSEGELLDLAVSAIRNFFNGVMIKDGDKVEFSAAVASVKLKISMRVMKDQTLDNFGIEDDGAIENE